MVARAIKTLLKNPNERNHREHRSKRGRRKNFDPFATDRKRKLETIKGLELDRESEDLI